MGDSSYLVCPRCTGIGSIRSVESMTLAILRLIGEEARKDKTAQIVAQVPVEVATYLMNEKREWLRTLEDKSSVDLMIVPNPHIQTPEYSIKRVRSDEIDLPENKQLSYKMPERPPVADPTGTRDVKPVLEPAAVIPTAPATSAPVVVHVPAPAAVAATAAVAAPPAGLGFWARLAYLFTGKAPEGAVAQSAPARSEPRRDGGERSGRDRNRPGGRHRDGGDRGRDRNAHGRDRNNRHGGRDAGRDGGNREASGSREAGERGGRDRHREHGRDRDAPREAGREPRRDAARDQAAPREPLPPRDPQRDAQREAERQAQRERNRERQREQQAAAAANPSTAGAAPVAAAPAATEGDAQPAFDAGNGNGPAQDAARGDGRGRRGRRRGRRGGGRNREAGQPNNGAGESGEGNFSGAREASDEEREFHAQMSNGNRGESHDQGGYEASPPRESAPEERSERSEAPREQQSSQAPLDLPPPPPSKPFVVWSSSPSEAPTPTPHRDE